MYKHSTLSDVIKGAKSAAKKPEDKFWVSVYVDSDPDWVGPDFVIDPADIEGLKIFREFAAKMAAHYNTLLNKIP